MINHKEKDYDKIIKERSDSFLAYVAKAAEDEMLKESEQWEIELSEVSIPKNTESEILKMADFFHNLRRKEEKKKQAKRYVKIAAAVILVVTTALTTLTVSVEAVRHRVFEFLFQENEEYMKVIPVETNGQNEDIKGLLPDDWARFYYPDDLPKGYLFEEAEYNGISHMMTFINEDGDVLLFSQQPADENKMIIDNEGTEKGEIVINGSPAFWVSKNDYTTLIWSQSSTRFMASGEVELDVLLQIAQNLIFVK